MPHAVSIIALIMRKGIVKSITVSNRCENLQVPKFVGRNFSAFIWEKIKIFTGRLNLFLT